VNIKWSERCRIQDILKVSGSHSGKIRTRVPRVNAERFRYFTESAGTILMLSMP
jgi:hypothetical protein